MVFGMNTESTSSNPPKAIVRLLEDARRRLVETGTRNRLIHINLNNDRMKVVHIVNERADDIYDSVRGSGKSMQFKALGIDDPAEDDLLIAAGRPEEPFDEAHYKDNFLETPLGPDKLAKRLLAIAKDSKTAEEEQGINLLYLAIGFLSWREDKNSKIERTAPLLLLPVELKRNHRTSIYDLFGRSDDLVTNLPLQERLREDFGVELPMVTEDEAWSPNRYFDLIASIVSGREGWSVDRNRMVLGLFSFAKILMMRDLDPENWAGNEILDHELLSGLVVSGFEPDPPLFPEDSNLDELMAPKDIIQVVDADASQTKVIEEVRAGRSLVVQGPPGTGKSQTITNIIAAAVIDGKTVLFVAEKMAALSVVHKRLVDVGLSDVCLELHSKNANKKTVLGELAETLNSPSAIPNFDDPNASLKTVRDNLNRIADLLHTPLKGRRFSPYSALSKLVRFIGQSAAPPKIANQSLADLSERQNNDLLQGIDRYQSLIHEMGPPADHPFYSIGETTLQPLDLERLQRDAEEAARSLFKTCSELKHIANWFGVRTPPSIRFARGLVRLKQMVDRAPRDIDHLIKPIMKSGRFDEIDFASEKALDYQTTWQSNSEKFVDAALEFPINELRTTIAAGTSFWTRLGGKYRNGWKQFATVLKGPIPKKQTERLARADALVELQKHKKAYDTQSQILRSILGTRWRDEESDFEGLQLAAKWC